MVSSGPDDRSYNLFSGWVLPGCRDSQNLVADFHGIGSVNGTFWFHNDEPNAQCQ